jgi:CRISPR system Cascade subunit CasC
VYLDIHILHSVPYANLNRDDTGRPKEGRYGGTPRVRVSAQSWKRAIRLRTDQDLIRSRRVPEQIAHTLTEAGWEPDAAQTAAHRLVGPLTSKSENGKPVLLFLHRDQISDLAALAGELGPDKLTKTQETAAAKRRDEIVGRTDGALALFGRMFANTPELSTDAAMQVAHALSTHPARIESDWFTAVDDLADTASDQGSGAGHLDSAEYASATFYRYLTINLTDLAGAVGRGSADVLLRAVLPAIATAMPSGKQSTTAAHTPPDLIALALRAAPLSYVGAFERPVTSSGEGYLAPSTQRLIRYAERVTHFTGNIPTWAGWAALDAPAADSLGQRYDAISELLDAAADTAAQG